MREVEKIKEQIVELGAIIHTMLDEGHTEEVIKAIVDGLIEGHRRKAKESMK